MDEGPKDPKLAKRIAAQRHRIKHPEKFGRGDAWPADELAKMEARLAEMLEERGPVKEAAQPAERNTEYGQGESAFTSRPRAEPMGPAYVLAERRTYSRRFNVDPATGELNVPTIEQLAKHAQRFGTDCVVEAATELGYGLDACVRLQDACDRVEANAYRESHPKSKPLSFPDAEARVKKLLGLKDEEPIAA